MALPGAVFTARFKAFRVRDACLVSLSPLTMALPSLHSVLLSCSHSAAGTNRALLCKSTADGLQVTQLNVEHTTENEDELFRLSQLGERGQWREGDSWGSPLLSLGAHVERRVKWVGCGLGLGTSLPGVESQFCGLLVGDVWNLLRFSVPRFPRLRNEVTVTLASGCGED